MFVKICGLTQRQDALAAVAFGAKAIGFVFAPSPRRADPDQIAPWIHAIPEDIWRVGVFVDESPARIEEIAAQLGLHIAQLHGNETPDLHPRNIRIWRAFRIKDSQTEVPDYPAEAIMIDGSAYDWSKAAHLRRPLILAGGLSPENVGAAIRRAQSSTQPSNQPWAVDVSSGIETSPGIKDHARMKQFIEASLCT
jgi:phosphoribosylanthranilate isomerase